MITYLYAIVDEPGSIDDLRGIGGEPLDVLTFGTLAVVAGRMTASPPIDPSVLERQDDIVRALHARAAALLPMRFGTQYASADEAGRAIKLRAAGLHDALQRVRGKEQMTMRAFRIAGTTGSTGATGATGPTDPTGAEYLRARAARLVPREIQPLLDALKPLQHGTHVEPGRAVGLVATVYHLIARGNDAEYCEAVQALAPAMPELSIRVTGPSPCYAFTS